MGIRESLASRQGLVAAVVLVVVGGFLFVRSISQTATPTSRAYFTIDDGSSQFVDAIDHLPPFDHHGKPAYRVWMFTADEGKTQFVGYLERYTPTAKARLQKEMDDFKQGRSQVPPQGQPDDTEIKKPGPNNPWVSRADARRSRDILNQALSRGDDIQVQLP